VFEVRRLVPYIALADHDPERATMRATLTVTAKGQVTLKKAILEHLAVGPGDRVEASLLADGRVELRPAGSRPPLSRVYGVLKRPGQRPVSLEEMQEAIEKGHDE